ncbi:hypothetical protein D3C79_980330 [compost metagenome]
MPSISPKPAATMRAGAEAKIFKSANKASGPIAAIVFFSSPIMIGAPLELKPSTDGAVGTDTNGMPAVYAAYLEIS